MRIRDFQFDLVNASVIYFGILQNYFKTDVFENICYSALFALHKNLSDLFIENSLK